MQGSRIKHKVMNSNGGLDYKPRYLKEVSDNSLDSVIMLLFKITS
jgi:hypothetical protein